MKKTKFLLFLIFISPKAFCMDDLKQLASKAYNDYRNHMSITTEKTFNVVIKSLKKLMRSKKDTETKMFACLLLGQLYLVEDMEALAREVYQKAKDSKFIEKAGPLGHNLKNTNNVSQVQAYPIHPNNLLTSVGINPSKVTHYAIGIPSIRKIIKKEINYKNNKKCPCCVIL